jgi:hypothetical protein
VSLVLAGSHIAAAQGNSAAQLRRFIDNQVGGLEKLIVPAHDADLPQPRLADGSIDPTFQITEVKRYLGKTALSRPDPYGQDPAGVRRRPRHETDRLVRQLSPG